MSIAKTRMLSWINGNKRENRIRNEGIHLKIEMTPIDEQMRKCPLRWFGHVQRKAITPLMRKRELTQVKRMKKKVEEIK